MSDGISTESETELSSNRLVRLKVAEIKTKINQGFVRNDENRRMSLPQALERHQNFEGVLMLFRPIHDPDNWYNAETQDRVQLTEQYLSVDRINQVVQTALSKLNENGTICGVRKLQRRQGCCNAVGIRSRFEGVSLGPERIKPLIYGIIQDDLGTVIVGTKYVEYYDSLGRGLRAEVGRGENESKLEFVTFLEDNFLDVITRTKGKNTGDS